MSNTPIVVAVLMGALAGQSTAGLLRFFFTSSFQPSGLTDPTLVVRPTLGNSQDAAHYQVAMFPPAAAAFETPDIYWHAGEFAYIWLRLTAVDTGYRIRGIGLDVDGAPADIAYYIVNCGNDEIGSKRWYGPYTAPHAAEFKQNPQILAAVHAAGIPSNGGPGDAWNLYQSGARTALLGAVRYDSDGLRTAALGSIGSPGFHIVFGAANWMPEPAAGASFLLCTLIARGRRSPCLGGTR